MNTTLLLSIVFSVAFPVTVSAQPPVDARTTFDRTQSAALFVGVQQFTDPSIDRVLYAVDDAVDLAFVVALDPAVNLVAADRVTLALSGEPVKQESQHRLKKLIAAGATRTTATQNDVLTLLRRQAAIAGKDGILIVAFATHGFRRDGLPYVLAASSVFQHEQTSLSTAKVLDIAAASQAARSLFFFDVCQQRVPSESRASRSNPDETVSRGDAETRRELPRFLSPLRLFGSPREPLVP